MDWNQRYATDDTTAQQHHGNAIQVQEMANNLMDEHHTKFPDCLSCKKTKATPKPPMPATPSAAPMQIASTPLSGGDLS